MLTILASYAQEESLSVSENMKWRIRKNFEDGKPWSGFVLGYRFEDGQYVIVPEEAEIVRLIYRMFMEGKSQSYIARYLMDNNIPSPSGKKIWQVSTVESILTNEKYKGEVKCTTSHLTEDALKEHTRQALSFLIENREALIEDGRLVKQALSDHTEIDAELRAIAEKMEVVAGLIEKSIATNAITALDQDEYAKTYESLTERYTALQKRYTNFRKAIAIFYKKVYNTCTT